MRLPPEDPTKEIAGTRSEHRVKMNRMRLKIAQRLKDAQNTNAMLTTFNELDMRYVWNNSLASETVDVALESIISTFTAPMYLRMYQFFCSA